MKKLKFIIIPLLIILLFVSCASQNKETNLWENAIYLKDTTIGNGTNSIILDVCAGDKTVSLTINSNKTTLGEILMENDIISGEKGPYGLYVKTVNGILADYDINKSYWSLTKKGEYVNTGVDFVEISNGDKYEFTYTK